ncbi:MAG TPA: molybdopterin cofactor-binding domain-containing protein [Cytophagales bacterium]|nr:molybdopterin cofactor-binding domain-containing protein [Cytophagales bacterium]
MNYLDKVNFPIPRTPYFKPNKMQVHEIENIERHSTDKNGIESKDGSLISRRRFFNYLGGGIAVVMVSGPLQAFNQPKTSQLERFDDDQIAAWLHIGEDGKITVFTGKVEVGQNIRTSLTQIVAEELQVPVQSITMIMGDTDLTPYDRGTFGSRTTPTINTKLQKVAATTREILLDQAAEKWKTKKELLKVSGGKIVNTKNQNSIEYGTLTKGKKIVHPIDVNVKVTPATQWKIAGKPEQKVDAERIITGKHQYVSDMKLPEMVYGKILRAPTIKSNLQSANVDIAKSMDGVKVVREKDFIGVTGPDLQTAIKAINSIKAEWNISEQPSKGEIFDYFKEKASKENNQNVTGNLNQGFEAAEKTLKASYTIDYIAHVPMEPRAALALWEGEKLTVWTGTQRPFGVREELAEHFGIKEEMIRVIMPDTGSAFGGKHSGEAAIEAARLAKAVQKPVKVVWTREEEFVWAYLRPAGLIEINAGCAKDGTITAWEFHNYNSGDAGLESLYTMPNKTTNFHWIDSPFKQGSYRALAATANNFARESHINEMARMINMDPLEFRLKNLKDDRMKDVLNAAAKAFGWKNRKPAENHGFGIACAFEKAGYVATCAEVVVDPTTDEVKIVRVSEAFDCGTVINPHHLEGQIVGAVIQGLGGALFESIDFENGKILNPKLSQYRVPRFKDVPPIEAIIVDNKVLPSSGAGETPILGIAPAIREAIVSATGIKLYTMPLVPNGKVTKEIKP